jgi:hypothetical protein
MPIQSISWLGPSLIAAAQITVSAIFGFGGANLEEETLHFFGDDPMAELRSHDGITNRIASVRRDYDMHQMDRHVAESEVYLAKRRAERAAWEQKQRDLDAAHLDDLLVPHPPPSAEDEEKVKLLREQQDKENRSAARESDHGSKTEYLWDYSTTERRGSTGT